MLVCVGVYSFCLLLFNGFVVGECFWPLAFWKIMCFVFWGLGFVVCELNSVSFVFVMPYIFYIVLFLDTSVFC